MKIVVLDGWTLNPGDLSWDALRALGDCAIHDRSEPKEVVPRAAGAEIALTNKVVVDRAAIAALPRLKYIGVLATGYNIVDVDAARERGIPVTNVPTYGTRSVAQLAFAHILELAHRIGHHAQTVREGRWTASRDFCYWDFPLIELEGLTLGLVGFGRIGQATAAIARAFGMRVIAHDVAVRQSPVPDVRMTDLETVFCESDVVSLHCPLTADNRGMVNAARLALMKPTAFLVNTSRGLLVNEADLAAALNAGRIAGAGVDVLSSEPPRGDNPLLSAKNCLVTPHIAWATGAARARMMAVAVDNIRAFLAGHPQNVVNGVS